MMKIGRSNEFDQIHHTGMHSDNFPPNKRAIIGQKYEAQALCGDNNDDVGYVGDTNKAVNNDRIRSNDRC